jgi:hypothetical protein
MELGSVPQFLTWRLDDSVPSDLIDRWRQELKLETTGEEKSRLYQVIERYADAGHGSCALRQPEVARTVQEALFYDHGRSYGLHAWCVMPNHVHALLTPAPGATLQQVVENSKGGHYTSHQ